MRIAAFLSHPIQYFTPLWAELSSRQDVDLTVYYFSRHGLDDSFDPGFGVRFAWNLDLLAGHKHQFLPRMWPTDDPLDYSPRALNAGIVDALREGWDAVYINGYAHWNNWLILQVCETLRIPVLCQADTNLQTEIGKSALKLAGKHALLSWLLTKVSAFLAPGGQSRAYFEHYGAPPSSVFISPYAVDVDRFRRAVADATEARWRELRELWRVPAHKRIVMFCGKLAPWKRPLDIVHALRRLDRSDVVGVFVGDGEERSRIEQQGGGLVVITGFVNQNEIPLALAMADVLVLSSALEPYGMVVAEAQCLGVPAVVTDACGCYGPESVLQDGVSGFVYPVGDVAFLADKLRALLDDPQLMSRMRACARTQGESQSQDRAADGFLAAVEYARTNHGAAHSPPEVGN